AVRGQAGRHADDRAIPDGRAVGRVAARHPAPLAALGARHAQPGAVAARAELRRGRRGRGEGEALLAAVTLLPGAQLPGVWVVMSRLTAEGGDFTEAQALALALTRSSCPRVLDLEVASSPNGGSLSLTDLEEAVARFEAGADVELPLGTEGRIFLRHGSWPYA